MKKRNVLAILLSAVMILSSSVVSMAADRTETMEEMIVQQAIELDDKTNWTGHDFSVVTLECDNKTERTVESEKRVIQSESVEDGIATLTTIIPYKVLEDGDVINSFEYADELSENSLARGVSYNDKVVDIVIVTDVEYEVVAGSDMWYYRHGGIKSYWSSSSSATTVQQLTVTYKTQGDLYTFSGNDIQQLQSSNHPTTSVISQKNPGKGTTYSAYDWTESGKVYAFTQSSYGTWVTVEVEFTNNGNSKYDRTDHILKNDITS